MNLLLTLLVAGILTALFIRSRRARQLVLRFISLTTRSEIVELLALTLLGLMFVGVFLEPMIGPENSAGGTEFERLSGAIIPIQVGLERYGQIPTWNPYMGTGVPMLGDAFNYFFNPFASVPVLVLGAIQGTKVALAIALIIASYGAWGLAKQMGIGAVGRVLAGALYMTGGGIAGKFNPGHFQLVIQLTWVPAVLACLWWVIHSPKRIAVVSFAITFALMFFSGNIYYTLHTIVCGVLIALLHLVERENGCWRIQWQRIKRFIIAGALAFGLCAIQFFPVWSVQSAIDHYGNPLLDGRYSLEQAVVNFVYPFPHWRLFERQDIGSVPMLVGVDYAYIGLVPFLLIGLGAVVMFATRAKKHMPVRALCISLILALFMMAWGAGQTGLIQWLYFNVELISEFRYVGRAHAIAALWWIMLASFALDAIWQAVNNLPKANSPFINYNRARLLRALIFAVLAWMAFWLFSVWLEQEYAAYGFPATSWVYSIYLLRFLNVIQALAGLWVFVVGALVIDTGLLIARNVLALILDQSAFFVRTGTNLRAYGTRMAQIALLVICISGIADLINVNSALFWYARRFADFVNLYNVVRTLDPNTPIPNVNEPESQGSMFQNYYNEVRNRNLNEGWTPLPVPGTFVRGMELGMEDDTARARWAIGWSIDHPDFGGFDYILQQCMPNALPDTRPSPSRECDIRGEMPGMLYELPNALPYSFIAPAAKLIYSARELNATNVTTPLWIEHQQDTVTIRAVMPPLETVSDPIEQTDISPYMLVVQETHFPGWRGYVDDVAVELVTIGVSTQVTTGFIGIPMLSGEHTYTLRYQPPGLSIGVFMTGITILLTGFYLTQRTTKP